ncbi:hypothetical protein [Ramlibacter alkalitolerans]|uniref:CHAD domain-containing protein n=1 Tax=Ramlibacter alkalitolerans TaxID=2039631 RepID=A0ABS1JUS0_9BURK|nr:hypothetical protein [Ramlibacter alkalitolerans]MBL0427963.1 hypothetical protein [Ramlibacter alkalitolerans]
MTPLSQANHLRQLEAKIKGLPIQDALLRRRQTYLKSQEEAQRHRAGLQVVLEQVEALRTIQGRPDLLAEAQHKRFGAVRARAREISALLNEPAPDNRKFSEKLEQIKRAGTLLSDEAKEIWRQLGEDHRNRASIFRPLAHRLSPNLGQRMQELDRLLAQGNAPPTDSNVVQAIVEARRGLDAEIAALRMDGPIETFLQEAQAGRGDPKALLDPQVREYLDAHPQLWKSLRVMLA